MNVLKVKVSVLDLTSFIGVLDMDNLATLPNREAPPNTQEEETINSLFPQEVAQPHAQSSSQPPPSKKKEVVTKDEDDAPPSSTSSSSFSWKLFGYTILLFLILVIPLIDKVICKLPYCGDSMIGLVALKTLIFAVGFFLILKYAH